MRVHRWSQFSSLSFTASVCGVLLLVSSLLLAQGKAKPKAPPPPEFADAASSEKVLEAVAEGSAGLESQ